MKRKTAPYEGLLDEVASKSGITRYELARRCGIPRSSVYKFDAQPGELPVKYEIRIQKLLKLSDSQWGRLKRKWIKKMEAR